MSTLKLHRTESGSSGKPAIIFIHGFPFNQTMWQEQVALCQENFRVITYDLRGHGQSGLGEPRYMFEFFVEDLLILMNELKIDKAVLCGLSMGGYIALRAAELHPDRLLGLALCDTRSESDADATKLKRAADLRLIQVEGLPVFADKFAKAVITPAHAQDSARVDRVKQMILGNPKEGVQATLVALATRTDTTASLARIKVPTLILVGSEDKITPPEAATAMHKLIPQSKLTVLPDASHLSNFDNPGAFNAALMEFLSGLRG